MCPNKNSYLNQGFTLIELLVVLAIIGIMAGIAIPQYAAYKQRGYDMRATSDLRNVATAEEVYFMDSERYLSCTNSGCTILPGIYKLSKGVSLSINAKTTSFTGTSSHPQGTGKILTWDSEKGGFQ